MFSCLTAIRAKESALRLLGIVQGSWIVGWADGRILRRSLRITFTIPNMQADNSSRGRCRDKKANPTEKKARAELSPVMAMEGRD